MTDVLLITGGASGIGAETARRAAKLGYKVAINYRTRDAQAMGLAAEAVSQSGRLLPSTRMRAPPTFEFTVKSVVPGTAETGVLARMISLAASFADLVFGCAGAGAVPR